MLQNKEQIRKYNTFKKNIANLKQIKKKRSILVCLFFSPTKKMIQWITYMPNFKDFLSIESKFMSVLHL